jgi:hypothetical protein
MHHPYYSTSTYLVIAARPRPLPAKKRKGRESTREHKYKEYKKRINTKGTNTTGLFTACPGQPPAKFKIYLQKKEKKESIKYNKKRRRKMSTNT